MRLQYRCWERAKRISENCQSTRIVGILQWISHDTCIMKVWYITHHVIMNIYEKLWYILLVMLRNLTVFQLRKLPSTISLLKIPMHFCSKRLCFNSEQNDVVQILFFVVNYRKAHSRVEIHCDRICLVFDLRKTLVWRIFAENQEWGPGYDHIKLLCYAKLKTKIGKSNFIWIHRWSGCILNTDMLTISGNLFV